MSADGFQRLYGEDVKKHIKKSEGTETVTPLPPQTHTPVTGKGYILGKRVGPVGNTDHRRRGQSTHSIVWRQERRSAANSRR